jgi:outer membrane protein
VTLGARVLGQPDYEGSDDWGFALRPIFGLRRVGENDRFSAPDDGIGIGLLDTGWLRAGPLVKFRGGRDQDDNRALRGLGDVGFAVEAGGFIELWPVEWLRLRADLRHGFGGHSGLMADAGIDVVGRFGQWTLSAGPRVSWSDDEYAQRYFGVNVRQSLRSGYAVFTPEGGIRSWGVGAQAIYRWDDRWTSSVYVEWDRLVGDVTRSPIVAGFGSEDQITVGVGLSYSFVVNW